MPQHGSETRTGTEKPQNKRSTNSNNSWKSVNWQGGVQPLNKLSLCIHSTRKTFTAQCLLQRYKRWVTINMYTPVEQGVKRCCFTSKLICTPRLLVPSERVAGLLQSWGVLCPSQGGFVPNRPFPSWQQGFKSNAIWPQWLVTPPEVGKTIRWNWNRPRLESGEFAGWQGNIPCMFFLVLGWAQVG